MNPKLEFFYDRKSEKPFRVDSHKHNCHELVYYINGNGITNIGGIGFEYSAGTFTLIKPDTLHDEYHYENTDLMFIGYQYQHPAIRPENGIYHDSQQVVYRIMNNIKKELSQKRQHFEWRADLLVSELLIELSRMNDIPYRKGDSFAYILRYMEENCNQPVSIEALAAIAGYSYHHFRHMFKERTGISPVNFVIKKRLQNACRLLETTEQSASEIALECGFYNAAQFSAMFRKETGQSPTSYRKSKLNGHE